MTIAIANSAGVLTLAGRSVRCSLGRSGVTAAKREGDGASPAGTWPMLALHYRADRLPAPATGLPMRPISRGDGWCDDPASPAYNQRVTLPFEASHEKMWREDGLYDALIVLGYNMEAPVPGLGSAIFLHIARPDFGPTEGCVALGMVDFLDLAALCGPGSRLVIEP